MLKKLLKHEWIATGRKYGLFYMVLAAVTLFTMLIRLIDTDNVILSGLQNFLIGIYVITLIGVLFCSIGYAVVRFYQNMVSGEGYLTFTLPATVKQLVGAKVIVAMVWQLITIAFVVLSALGVFVLGHMEWSTLTDTILGVNEMYKGVIPAFLVMITCSMFFQLLVCYLAISIGQLFTGNKVVGSIVGYCIVYFVTEMIMLAGVILISVIVGVDDINAYANSAKGMPMLLLVVSAMMLAFGLIEYFLTTRILAKKLNLN